MSLLLASSSSAAAAAAASCMSRAAACATARAALAAPRPAASLSRMLPCMLLQGHWRRDYNVNGNEVKTGSTIRWDDKTWLVIGTAVNMRGRAHTTYNIDLKDVSSASKISIKVRPADKIEVIEMTPVRMNYLYRSGRSLFFMDPATFEQVEVPAALCGRESRAAYLVENSSVQLTKNGDTYVRVAVPDKVVCTVQSTVQSKPGKVNDSSGKDALLTNGLTVQVPMFIENGAHIVINTDTDGYVGKSEVPPTAEEEPASA